ncbi:glutathione S-transferase [Geopyxis carbonaria]|nr:glutathione S-transferase [Geopyxis carbonaria]
MSTYSDANPQFTLYSHPGPNPWKVAVVLRTLKLTYRLKAVNFMTNEHKSAPYTEMNPNGRMPTLVDHSNGDFTIWESGAIMLYLLSRYDTEHVLNFADAKDEAHAVQWLMFQMSGQGPMWGQLFWFLNYHEEKLPSAVERYRKEMMRTIEVLDTALEKQGGWLVGGRLSYADLSFLPWMKVLTMMDDTKALVGLGEKGEEDVQYKNFYKWYKAMTELPAWQACNEEWTEEGKAARAAREAAAAAAEKA